MAIIIERTVNLDALGVPEQAQGTLYQQENLAHKFVIEGKRNGQHVDLTGTVSGSFIRPDGETVALTGTLESGKAAVTLTGQCYDVTGRFTLTVFVTSAGATTALYSMTGNVRQTETGTVVDPGTILPGISDLINRIDTAVESIPPEYSALTAQVDKTEHDADMSVAAILSFGKGDALAEESSESGAFWRYVNGAYERITYGTAQYWNNKTYNVTGLTYYLVTGAMNTTTPMAIFVDGDGNKIGHTELYTVSGSYKNIDDELVFTPAGTAQMIVQGFGTSHAIAVCETEITSKLNRAETRRGDFISIAHQGYSETESTNNNRLSGYARAAGKGFDYAECDVQMTRNNVPVCCHEGTFIDATTGNTITIASENYADLIGYDYYGETIASLDEVIASCKAHGIGVVIDQISPAKLTYILPIVKLYAMERRTAYILNYISNSTLVASMIQTILAFDPCAYIMIIVNQSTIADAITAVTPYKTAHNKIDFSLNYATNTVENVKTLIPSLPAGSHFTMWTIDGLATCKAYLPYVAAITSNKISTTDLFG